ncbi:hypothetical protein HRR83_006670 [Exophiala dermatitidis]|uniref:Uncharacterized protein n=1 Tax=Exophiala dermatitidis TaxID=5970 RepID=A0AAN6ERP7_EXODE|nr:hypothetical protein HRR74_005830 [Exophiala dermatitidis]KAJ4515345.1 hypothetical protein HRR73_005176 [Exophiala dermatitidis]KAJ4533820.1 hypothetical protein HRR77_008304 [Exophiala dermatitidis]KAJ4540871.1 hypothetical protein HRR76_004255 [Exophiala dermatitidis]KAJ4560504.1 hypothetical protein HRR79_007912 [Exophiala dermatitidis]
MYIICSIDDGGGSLLDSGGMHMDVSMLRLLYVKLCMTRSERLVWRSHIRAWLFSRSGPKKGFLQSPASFSNCLIVLAKWLREGRKQRQKGFERQGSVDGRKKV